MRRGIAAVALAASLAAGCSSDETGIVFVVGLGADQPAPADLVVMIGSAADADAATWYDSAPERFSVADRDLAADPLRYMVRPGSSSGPINVAFAGVVPESNADGPILLTAHYPEPLEFHSGVVLEVPVTLGAGSEDQFDECGRCFRHLPAPSFQVVSDFDRDCDGALAHAPPECAELGELQPPDCDDSDPTLSPTNIEICDGRDNNCDGSTSDYAVGCFGTNLECLFGTQSCADETGEWRDCMLGADGQAAPEDLCTAWSGCAAKPDAVDCLASAVGRTDYLCRVKVAAAQDFATCNSGVAHSFPSTCDSLFVMEGFDGAQLPAGSVLETPSKILCELAGEFDLVFSAETLPRPARVTVVETTETERRAHVFHFEPDYVEACDQQAAISCTPQ